METNMPFRPVEKDIPKLQLLSRDLEEHKEWIASKTGGIDQQDVIYIMGDNNAESLILVILRRHKTLLFMLILFAYAIIWMLGFGWFSWRLGTNL